MRRQLGAHLEMWRPYTLAYAGLVGLAGAALAAPGPVPGTAVDPPGWRFVGAWAVPTLGWLGGLYGGDYFDRELDATAKPHRPIPSGRVRPGTARAAMVCCVSAGGVLAVALNWRTVLLVGVALAGGIAYSTWFKARGLSGNLVRGGLTAGAFLFGTMAVTDYPPAWLLPAAAFFWLHDAGSNLVGTLRDLDGDRRGGYGTLPVRRGVRTALGCIALLYVSWLAIAVALPVIARSGGAATGGAGQLAGYAALLGTAAVLGLAVLVLLVRARSPPPPRVALGAHEVLVVERVILAGALLALGAGAAFALPLVAAGTGATWLAQHLMRERYEFASPVPPAGRRLQTVRNP